MAYTVKFKPSAAKQLKKLAKRDQLRVGRKIDALITDPRPHGCKKLEGIKELHRVPAGDYRIVYQIQARRLLVLVVRIGHRKDIYRKR